MSVLPAGPGAPIIWDRRDGTWVAAGRGGATTTPTEPTPPPPAPTPDESRPTGPEYVAYEDLYRAGDTFSSVIGKVTNNRILTLPSGEFSFRDFRMGYVDGIRMGNGGYTGCRGLVGSGREQTLIKMVPGSSTRQAEIEAIEDSSGNNPAVMINIDRMPGAMFKNFTMHGGDNQGTAYSGLRVTLCDDAIVENVKTVGVNPGYSNAPPGETMGIICQKSNRMRLVNCEADGRDPYTGTRITSSPFGWNSSRDAYVGYCHAHHGRTGMMTFWRTVNVTVEHSVFHSTASGGGNQSGSAINFEDAGGVVRVRNCDHRPWGRWERQHGNTSSDVTDNSGLHIALATGNAVPPMTDVRVYLGPSNTPGLPSFDRGPHSSGAFACANWNGYPNQSTEAMTALRVWNAQGVEMEARNTKISGYGNGVTRDTHFLIYK